jgi:hypothetical protein
MTGKKHPPKALLKELKKLYDKHNWSGSGIGMRMLSSAADTESCPDGTTPHEIRYQDASGTWVTKTVCL